MFKLVVFVHNMNSKNIFFKYKIKVKILTLQKKFAMIKDIQFNAFGINRGKHSIYTKLSL